jgi:aminomethyltransferase
MPEIIMKQTALMAVHTKQSVRMTEFQGWSLPAQFSDPSEEHHAVRTAAGLFDVGFLGRTEVAGPEAERLLQSLFTRDIEKLTDGSILFGLFCDEQGFAIDASLVFRLTAGRNGRKFLITSSPGATEKLAAWLTRHAGNDVQIIDRTAETGQLALQGPLAEVILHVLAGASFKKVKDKRLREMRIVDTSVLVSRTGYTGERGYELIAPADRMPALWAAILATGAEYGLVPCGMVCRDILRLEAGYVQTGTDLSGSRTPLEAGLSPFVDLNKTFIGRDALAARKAEGVRERLIGFELFSKGIPRPGGTIFSESREIGVTTSGNHSPYRRRDIGLGYVLTRYAQPGQEIEVEVKDREVSAQIVDIPFYHRK